MNNISTVAIFGSTGTQGKAVAERLQEKFEIVALGRQPAKLQKIGFRSFENRVLDGFSEEDVSRAIGGVDAAFVQLPLASGLRCGPLLQACENICAAIKRSDVSRVVWTTSWLVTEKDSSVSENFDTLRKVTDAVLSLPIETVVIKPAGYLENFLTSDAVESINRGVLAYMLPDDFRYRWASARDQARVVERALSSGSVRSAEYLIGTTLDGRQLVEAASQGIGRNLSYDYLTPDAFADHWRPTLGDTADVIAQDYLDIVLHPDQLGLNCEEPSVNEEFNFECEEVSAFFERNKKQFF